MATWKLPFESVAVQDVEHNMLQYGNLTSLIDVCGFFLCRRGHARVMLNGRVYDIGEHDVYIYLPSTFVSLLERSNDLEGMAVKTSLDVVLPFLEKSASTTDVMVLSENPCFHLTEQQLARFDEMTAMLESRRQRLLQSDDDSASSNVLYQQIQSLTEAFFYEMLGDFFDNQCIQPEPPGRDNRVFQSFMLSLMRNYKREREVTYYAGQQCLTPRYFTTVVRRASGHTPSEWIVEMVVTNARQQLQHTDKSVKQIAMEFNFPTLSLFGKYIKQHTGFSPRELIRSSKQ